MFDSIIVLDLEVEYSVYRNGLCTDGTRRIQYKGQKNGLTNFLAVSTNYRVIPQTNSLYNSDVMIKIPQQLMNTLIDFCTDNGLVLHTTNIVDGWINLTLIRDGKISNDMFSCSIFRKRDLPTGTLDPFFLLTRLVRSKDDGSYYIDVYESV